MTKSEIASIIAAGIGFTLIIAWLFFMTPKAGATYEHEYITPTEPICSPSPMTMLDSLPTETPTPTQQASVSATPVPTIAPTPETVTPTPTVDLPQPPVAGRTQ